MVTLTNLHEECSGNPCGNPCGNLFVNAVSPVYLFINIVSPVDLFVNAVSSVDLFIIVSLVLVSWNMIHIKLGMNNDNISIHPVNVDTTFWKHLLCCFFLWLFLICVNRKKNPCSNLKDIHTCLHWGHPNPSILFLVLLLFLLFLLYILQFLIFLI